MGKITKNELILDLKTEIENSTSGLAAHKADYVRQPAYGATTGGANTYLFASIPALPALIDGVSAYLDINVENTGTSTLDWDGTGVRPIVSSKGIALTAGKLPLNGIVGVRYNLSIAAFMLQGDLGDIATPYTKLRCGGLFY
jgi:hypothetical protein